MNQHSSDTSACQSSNGDSGAVIPIDYAITVRFGDALLEEGHTCVPNLVLDHYAQLGLAPAEMMVIIHIWQYWWTTKNPFPALGTIAAKMGLTRRQVRHYVSGLKAKGYLRVMERELPGLGQLTSEYDFTPLLEAIVTIARVDEAAGKTKVPVAIPRKEASQAPRKDSSYPPGKDSSSEQDEGQAYKVECISKASKDTSRQDRAERTPARRLGEPTAFSERINQLIIDWSGLFHDAEHKRSNCTRAQRLWTASSLEESEFVELMYEARRIAQRATKIRHLACDDSWPGTPNRMPYFFAALENLAHGDQSPQGEDDCWQEQQSAEHMQMPAALQSASTTVPEAPHDTHPVWSAVLTELHLVLTAENFNTWLARTRVVREEGQTLYIAVPKPFHKEWLEHKLNGRIATTLQRLGYGHVRVEYVIEAAA